MSSGPTREEIHTNYSEVEYSMGVSSAMRNLATEDITLIVATEIMVVEDFPDLDELHQCIGALIKEFKPHRRKRK